MSYNFVDIAIVVILLAFAYFGARRGFLAGVTDIAAMIVAFLFAIRGYGFASGWLSENIDLPRILINFITLMGLFMLGEWLFGLATGPLLRLFYEVLPGPARWIDAVAGIVPGLLKGSLLATALVTFLALFPVNDGIHAQVQSAALGSRLAEAASASAPQVESLFGGSARDTALFITQPSEEEGPRQMNFPAGLTARVDVAAEERMLALVNKERVAAGLQPLVSDSRLRNVAEAHSQDMFDRSYFAHESPSGDTPADRLQRAGIPYIVMGENLAYAPSVEVAHTGLMNSPGHRRNILSAQYGRVGIGVVEAGIYGRMFSQEFSN